MQEKDLVGIEIDKCVETFSIRIPEILKLNLDKFSPSQKARLKQELLFIMAKHVHDVSFDPEKYLSTRDI
jgi:hypothetical protein